MHDLRWWILVPYCFIIYGVIKGKNQSFKRHQWAMIYGLLGFVFFASGITKFLAFEFNGIDFSVFDWMLHYSINGQFMRSPACECNHFGVHPTWLMTTLIPLHYLWQSPWLLVIVHAFSLSITLPLLVRMLRFQVSGISDLQILLILCSVAASQFMGSIANYGFHYEVWYLPLGLWFLYSWQRGTKSWIWAALLFAGVKEDGALYLASWAIGTLLGSDRRREGLLLLVSSAVFFFINTKLLQPLAWSTDQFTPSWTSFWLKYGNSTSEVILGAFNRPTEAAKDILTSGIWRWLIPFAFAPLFSMRTLVAMAPGIIMLGLSSVPVLRGYGIYYGAPLIPFALASWIALLDRLHFRLNRQKFAYALIALTILLGFVGGVGPRLGKLKPEASLAVAVWLRNNAKSADTTTPICIQTALYPHMGYLPNIKPLLSVDCGANTVIHSNLDPYPFADRTELLRHAAAHHWEDLGIDLNSEPENQAP